MWTDCITSISYVLKLNGYGRRQAKVNGKRLRFKGWETLVTYHTSLYYSGIAKRVGDNAITIMMENNKCFVSQKHSFAFVKQAFPSHMYEPQNNRRVKCK